MLADRRRQPARGLDRISPALLVFARYSRSRNAIPLGLLAAVYRGTIIDRLSGAIAVLGIATPSFWLGIVLIYVFSIKLGLLPSSRMGGPSHYVLPTITLGLSLVAGMMRLVRSSLLEVLGSEFVKLA